MSTIRPEVSAHRRSMIPLRTTLLYAVAGILWIIVSDEVLAILAPSPEAYAVMQTYKGWAFIVATSLLLFLALRGQFWVLEQETARRLEAQIHVQRLNRVYAMLSGINQAIVRSPEPEVIFQKACQIAVDEGGFLVAWIGIIDRDKRTLNITASAAQNSEHLTRLALPLAPGIACPEGQAATTGKESIVNNIANDGDIPYREQALQFGCRAIASFPLVVKGETRGVFNLYARETGYFDEEEIALLRELALDIAFGIAFSEQDTQRKQAEEELRQSELRYHSLVEYAPDAIFLDVNGRVALVNKACKRLFGVEDAKSLVGRSPLDLFIPEEHTIIRERIQQLQCTGVPGPPAEQRLARPDGTIRDVEVVAAPFPLGGTNAVHVILRDITERKKSQASLLEAQERLRRAVSAGNIGLWDWDLCAQEVYYSPEWKRQIGYADHEIGTSPNEWHSRIHPDDAEASHQSLQIAIANPRRNCAAEYRFRHKDGSYRWILCHASVFVDAQDKPIRMLGSHLDVTERKHLEDQFLQSQKMESVGRLAGGIAHDFNNLLSVIIGFTEMVLEDLDETSPLASDIREIRNAGTKAASLTRQLLTFSRKQVLQPEIIDLGQLVADSTVMLRRLVGEDVEFSVVRCEMQASIKADRGQIEQVLMNLVVNARDAMPQGGKLIVEVQQGDVDEAASIGVLETVPGPFVVLAVSDTGLGMDPHTMRNLFEPFFTTKGVGQGTGLGLATVYGIVRQCGGQIVVNSELGCGSTFKIFLPLVNAEGKDLRVSRIQESTRGTETILLVEDEPTLRIMTERILANAGYTIVSAGNGADAITRLEQCSTPIHLLLTDVVMPGMSGRELAECVVKSDPGIAVIYMSGYANDAVVRHGVLDEQMNFIGKPFTAIQLTRKIRAVLDSDPLPGAKS